MVGCGVKDIKRSFTSDQTNRLLSGDDSKHWMLDLRIADGLEITDDCIMDNELVFVKADAGDSLYILGRNVGCESIDEADTLYKAQYEINIDDELNYLILLTDERRATVGSMIIENLTSSALTLQYSIDGVQTLESYDQRR